MKTPKRILAVSLALGMLLLLCACGGSAPAPTPAAAPMPAATAAPGNPLAPYAGEYRQYSVMLDGVHVIMDEYEAYTVTLSEDGTGYLDWGADNQGPISAWSIEGETLRVKAGVSEMTGSLKDGVMQLDLGDGFGICFVTPGADTSSMPRISLEEYRAQAEDEEPEAPEDAVFPVEGEYTLFAVGYQGYTADAAELGMASTIRLDADGSGRMTLDEEGENISSWTKEGTALMIVMADGGSAPASVENGILALDLYADGSMILYYAQEGADTSSIQVMSMDEIRAALESEMSGSRVNMVWRGMVEQDGSHLRYDKETKGLDAQQHFDVYSRDGEFCSRQITEVSGREQEMIVFFRDGKAYNLYPKDMTGVLATTTESSVITDNVMMLDSLYAVIFRYARQTEFTEETRDFNGASCTAAVYPATEYTPETVFFFDDADRLVGVMEGAPVLSSAAEIGETVYTVIGIDDQIDESLFDISGYTIG